MSRKLAQSIAQIKQRSTATPLAGTISLACDDGFRLAHTIWSWLTCRCLYMICFFMIDRSPTTHESLNQQRCFPVSKTSFLTLRAMSWNRTGSAMCCADCTKEKAVWKFDLQWKAWQLIDTLNQNISLGQHRQSTMFDVLFLAAQHVGVFCNILCMLSGMEAWVNGRMIWTLQIQWAYYI